MNKRIEECMEGLKHNLFLYHAGIGEDREEYKKDCYCLLQDLINAIQNRDTNDQYKESNLKFEDILNGKLIL